MSETPCRINLRGMVTIHKTSLTKLLKFQLFSDAFKGDHLKNKPMKKIEITEIK